MAADPCDPAAGADGLHGRPGNARGAGPEHPQDGQRDQVKELLVDGDVHAQRHVDDPEAEALERAVDGVR